MRSKKKEPVEKEVFFNLLNEKSGKTVPALHNKQIVENI